MIVSQKQTTRKSLYFLDGGRSKTPMQHLHFMKTSGSRSVHFIIFPLPSCRTAWHNWIFSKITASDNIVKNGRLEIKIMDISLNHLRKYELTVSGSKLPPSHLISPPAPLLAVNLVILQNPLESSSLFILPLS